MDAVSSTANDDKLLAAAMSAIMDIHLESSVNDSKNSNKISLFDYHNKTYSYGRVGDTLEYSRALSGNITLFVKTSHGKVIQCCVPANSTVKDLKNAIKEAENIPVDQQRLVFAGKQLEDGRYLSYCGIQHECTLHLVLRLQDGGEGVYILDPESQDPRYNYDFTNLKDENEEFTRGGMKYVRPCGWKRFAINVSDKFKDLAWLGSTNKPGEWPVSYHGTGKDAAKTIATDGYNLTKGKRFAYGYGIYSTPDLKVAEQYAVRFSVGNDQYLVVLQNRVNPNTLIKISADRTHAGEYWINPSDQDVRPYGICIRKL